MKAPSSPPARVREDAFFLPDLCANGAVLMLVIAAELLAVVATLLGSGVLAFDWPRLGLVSVFVQWIALAAAGLLCKLRPWLQRLPERRAVLAAWAVAPVLAWLMSAVVERYFFDTRGLAACLGADRVLRNTVIAAIIGGLVLRYFFLQAQLLARRQSELRHQIQALHSRIQPHFLFNSMNSIASLISVDPDMAEQVVEDLSELFRASLGDVGQLVPLAREIELCRRYLRIEQLRLGDRLRVHWHEKPVPAEVKIPRLALQPLIENAIVHGVQPLPEGGDIDIHIGHSHGVCEIRVENPVAGAGDGSDSGNRMALDNIRDRLRVLYGERAKTTAYIEHNRYIAHMTYPFDTVSTTP